MILNLSKRKLKEAIEDALDETGAKEVGEEEIEIAVENLSDEINPGKNLDIEKAIIDQVVDYVATALDDVKRGVRDILSGKRGSLDDDDDEDYEDYEDDEISDRELKEFRRRKMESLRRRLRPGTFRRR